MKSARMSYVLPVVLLALVASISRAEEDTKANPYESIVARNPFQLREPPPEPDPSEMAKPPPPPLATVECTGVLDLRSKKLALLEIVPGPGKPPIKPTLGEGERVESVEVISIDVDEGFVKIKNGEVITNIALKVPNKQPGPAVAGLPGQPGFPPQGLAPNPQAGFVNPVVNPSAAANANNSAYGRGGNVMVVGGSSAPATPTAAGAGAIAKPYGNYGAGATVPGVQNYGATPNYGSGSGVSVTGGGATVPGGGGVNVSGGGELPSRQIPVRPIRGAQPQGLTPTPDQVHNDQAAQYLNMAIQKQQMESRGMPMPPLPTIPGFDPNQ